MKKINILLLASLSVIFTGCINDDEYGIPDSPCVELVKTKEVVDITSAATATYAKYNNDDIIEAYVTSSDEGGNFYKSISLVSTDGTVGFSMPINAYDLYSKFEPGRKVFVNMKNRYFVTENSSTVIGSLYNNETPDVPTDDKVGRISAIDYQNIIKRSCTKVNEDDIVKHMTIAQAKNNQNLNKLIEFDYVQFTDPSLGKKYFDPSLNNLGSATNHLITDEFGNTVILRVSEFATFSANKVPSKNGKIRGVMTKFGSDFQFMVRTEDDIKLTGNRLTIDMSPPKGGTAITYTGAFTEPFTSYTGTNLEVFPKYINDAVTGSRYWQLKTFSGNKYIQMSSFGGTPEANRTIFVVPVDMTAASTFSFKTVSGFDNGSPLKVYYSTNYIPGTNVNNATLVNITSNFTIPNGPASGYAPAFTSSGVYNIPAGITGNGYFIFEYTGNGSGGITTTMQIDDITVN